MRYKYLAAYKLIGLRLPVNNKEQLLCEYPAISANAFITSCLDSHLSELDRASAIGNFMLNFIIGHGSDVEFEERLERELVAINKKRKEKIGDGVFVIFEAEGELESFNHQNEKELPDFNIVIDGAEKQPIRDKYQVPISGILSGFVLGSEQVYSIQKVTDGIIFINVNDKPVYSYTLEVNAKAMVSSILTEDAITFVRNNAKSLGKHQKLVDSARLLSKSLNVNNDDLQSFLLVWAGMEIFVNKNFKEFEEVAFTKLNGGDTPVVPSVFFRRIKNVMNDKYRLTDKFSLISSELSPDSSDEDIKQFEVIKGIRDTFMHAHDIPISTLPTENTRILLKKYLKLYVQKFNN